MVIFMLDLNFTLDENYLAYFILNRTMHNEQKEISDLKVSLKDDIGFKKIIKKVILDKSIYLNEGNNDFINEFIKSDIFNNIYMKYNNEDKEVIALKLLTGYIKEVNNELENYKDILWDKYRNEYQRILKVGFYNPSDYLLDQDVLNTINRFKESNEFKKLYEDTNDYCNYLKNIWKDYKGFINDYLNRILKTKFDLVSNVYVSHPNANVGYSFDGNIAWGHYKGIDNLSYNLTYLVHEAMHTLFPFKDDENEEERNIKHAIIELISDYELQSMLKGESTLKDGHIELNDYRYKIYPYWLKYIGLTNDQINERLLKDNITIQREIKDDLSKLNIDEFISYCQKNLSVEKIK